MRVDVAAIEAVQERLREKRSRGGGVGGETLRDEVQQLYGTYLRMIYICDGLDTWSKVLVLIGVSGISTGKCTHDATKFCFYVFLHFFPHKI